VVFTFDDMERFASETYGSLGEAVATTWKWINDIGFAGKLKPIPIVLTPTLPFGGGYGEMSRFASASEDADGWKQGRSITLVVAAKRRAGNNDLLHSMVHQFIFEILGEDPRHDSAAWRAEIMRLHRDITDREIWAGPPITARQGRYRVVRVNKPGPDGATSLTQRQIAAWPAGFAAIDLGPLGGIDPT
jgi:hypothetical protein